MVSPKETGVLEHDEMQPEGDTAEALSLSRHFWLQGVGPGPEKGGGDF